VCEPLRYPTPKNSQAVRKNSQLCGDWERGFGQTRNPPVTPASVHSVHTRAHHAIDAVKRHWERGAQDPGDVPVSAVGRGRIRARSHAEPPARSGPRSGPDRANGNWARSSIPVLLGSAAHPPVVGALAENCCRHLDSLVPCPLNTRLALFPTRLLCLLLPFRSGHLASKMFRLTTVITLCAWEITVCESRLMHVVVRLSVGGARPGSAGPTISRCNWHRLTSDRCRVVAARQNPVHVIGDGARPSITVYSSASRGDPI